MDDLEARACRATPTHSASRMHEARQKLKDGMLRAQTAVDKAMRSSMYKDVAGAVAALGDSWSAYADLSILVSTDNSLVAQVEAISAAINRVASTLSALDTYSEKMADGYSSTASAVALAVAEYALLTRVPGYGEAKFAVKVGEVAFERGSAAMVPYYAQLEYNVTKWMWRGY